MDEDETISQKQRAHEEAVEQTQKLRIKNNDLLLKLQECSLLVLRDKREVEMRAEQVAKREQAVAHREKEVTMREEIITKREQAVAQIEADAANRVHEINELKERLASLECNQN